MKYNEITVTVARSPSGTLATMIPIRKMTAVINSYLRISERMKKVTPRPTATPVMMWIKCSISTAIGVFPDPNPLAKLAILPMTVLSPICTTTPVQVPSTAFVEKNAKFFVSRGFSWENSGVRVWGSDSPVREELSTYWDKEAKSKTSQLLHVKWCSWDLPTSKLQKQSLSLPGISLKKQRHVIFQNPKKSHPSLFQGWRYQGWKPSKMHICRITFPS